ncbi:hypothetical protein ACOMHN_038414 [Nucella lapillus]
MIMVLIERYMNLKYLYQEFCVLKEHTSITPGRRLGGEKDAPVPQSRAHQREQPEEPVGCLRGLLIRGARRLPPGLCDVRSPTGCLSIILYERGYSSCIRSIGERVPRPGPQCASDGVSPVRDAAPRPRNQRVNFRNGSRLMKLCIISKALMHHGVTTDDIRHRTSIQHKKDWPQYRTLRHAVPKRRTV